MRSRTNITVSALLWMIGTLASAQTCNFVISTAHKTKTLTNDCVTGNTIYVPDGYTLNGNGHLITAVDPNPSANVFFAGPVVTNVRGASTATVKNLIIDTPNLAANRATCDLVFGILFHNVSGTIKGNTILHTGFSVGSPCFVAIGTGIEVETVSPPMKEKVMVLNNKVFLANVIALDIEGPDLTVAASGNQLSVGTFGATPLNVNAVGAIISHNTVDTGANVQTQEGINLPFQSSAVKVLDNNINLISGNIAFQGIGIQIGSDNNTISGNRVFNFGIAGSQTIGIANFPSANPTTNVIRNNQVRCYETAFLNVALPNGNVALTCPF